MSHPPVIAIVDDDQAMREALSDLFDVAGLRSRIFEGGEAFLAALEPGAFACVVTDVRMPGMSGLELQRRLRAIDETLPVIVISSAVDGGTEARALADGARAYFTKPIGHDLLLTKLRDILG